MDFPGREIPHPRHRSDMVLYLVWASTRRSRRSGRAHCAHAHTAARPDRHGDAAALGGGAVQFSRCPNQTPPSYASKEAFFAFFGPFSKFRPYDGHRTGERKGRPRTVSGRKDSLGRAGPTTTNSELNLLRSKINFGPLAAASRMDRRCARKTFCPNHDNKRTQRRRDGHHFLASFLTAADSKELLLQMPGHLKPAIAASRQGASSYFGTPGQCFGGQLGRLRSKSARSLLARAMDR